MMTKWQSWSRVKELLVFSLLLLISSCPLLATERPIDLEQSTITVHVGKSGLFSAAGHEHTVSAPIAAGAINDSEGGHVWFRVDTAKMTVLPEKDQEAVESTMQRSVLESAKFPEIRFASTSIRKIGDRRWTVSGDLTLHGETRSIPRKMRRAPVKTDVQERHPCRCSDARVSGRTLAPARRCSPQP